MYLICSLLSSLAIIILFAPLLYQNLHASKLTKFACVLTFIATSGAYFFITSITPGSAAIIPSGFASFNYLGYPVRELFMKYINELLKK